MMIYCVGLPSSASTWIYNVAREILTVGQVDHVAFRAETLGDFQRKPLSDAKTVLVKGHHAEPFLMRILMMADVKILMTVRDPRDAITSLVQRFGSNVGAASMQVNRSLSTILTLAQRRQHCVYYFEDRFYDDPGVVEDIADFLNVTLDADQVGRIFDRFRAKAIQTFTQGIGNLPADRRQAQREGDILDMDTGFHRTHIGDMKIGKWASFFESTVATQLDHLFGSYAAFFAGRGLGAGVAREGALGDVLFDVAFTDDLFPPINDPNNYERELSVAESMTEFGVKVLDNVYLPVGLWDLEFMVDVDGENAAITACQDGQIVARLPDVTQLKFTYHNQKSASAINLCIDPGVFAGRSHAPPARLTAHRRVSAAGDRSEP